MKTIRYFLIFTAFAAALGSGCKSQPETVPAAPGGNIQGIFAGTADVFILRDDNSLWGTGYGLDEGLTRIIDDTGTPFSEIKTVAAGENHVVILRPDGTLWGFGSSSSGELGLRAEKADTFIRLKAGDAPLEGIRDAMAGNNSTFYIDAAGNLWAAGHNYYGELGLGNRDVQYTFIRVESAGQNVKSLAAGIRHTVILKENGSLWAAGYNFNGQLGLGDTEDRDSFTELTGAGAGITAVAAGSYHTVILKDDGSVWTAGSNYWGQLGFTGKKDRPDFTRVIDTDGAPLTGVKEIAARGNITALLKEDGSLLIAGNYRDAEGGNDLLPDNGFGDGEEPEPGEDESAFAALAPENGEEGNFGGVKKIILGYNSIYVIASDKRLWAAGSNRYGQLGLDAETEIAPALKLTGWSVE